MGQWVHLFQSTVGCRYNTVQYSMMMLQCPRFKPQNTPIPRTSGRAMGCLLCKCLRNLTAFYRHRTVITNWIYNPFLGPPYWRTQSHCTVTAHNQRAMALMAHCNLKQMVEFCTQQIQLNFLYGKVFCFDSFLSQNVCFQLSTRIHWFGQWLCVKNGDKPLTGLMMTQKTVVSIPLQWLHNERDDVSN